MLAVNNKNCFARVSGTHLWKISLGQKFKSSTSDRNSQFWQDSNRKWSFQSLDTSPPMLRAGAMCPSIHPATPHHYDAHHFKSYLEPKFIFPTTMMNR